MVQVKEDVTWSKSANTVTFLPEPERRSRRYLVISADDHVVEPPNMFEGRIPQKLRDRAPRVVEDPDTGNENWLYDGELIPNVGFNALSGRPTSEYGFEPTRFDQMRRGAWDVDFRVKDMDLDGIYASVNFPSHLGGFAGQRLQLGHDLELGRAAARAWNSFMLEEWVGRYPDRFIPLQLPILDDPEVCAEEIRRNAQLGFKAVAFSEGPHALGLPSLHTGYWDPAMRACEETGTAVCLHFGSSGVVPGTALDAPPEIIPTLFGMNIGAAVDWLFSLIPVRFPTIKICLAEGGVGWVPCLLDRLDHMMKYKEMFRGWTDISLTPAEVFSRNFYVCALDEASAMLTRHRTGIDKIVLETDFPHMDATWPDTQSVLDRSFRGLPPDEVAAITWKNASQLFRHPVPESVVADPELY
jgi:predicted TIM-barrel fold metal-dependent hydrolase